MHCYHDIASRGPLWFPPLMDSMAPSFFRLKLWYTHIQSQLRSFLFHIERNPSKNFLQLLVVSVIYKHMLHLNQQFFFNNILYLNITIRLKHINHYIQQALRRLFQWCLCNLMEPRQQQLLVEVALNPAILIKSQRHHSILQCLTQAMRYSKTHYCVIDRCLMSVLWHLRLFISLLLNWNITKKTKTLCVISGTQLKLSCSHCRIQSPCHFPSIHVTGRDL